MSFPNNLIIILYSFFPALALVFFFRWLDRFQKQPLMPILWAFVWGSFGAGLISFFLNTFFLIGLGVYNNISGVNELINAIIIAPVVEEFTKVLFLFLLLFLGRIDNVTDGILYGLVIGLGFAASENISYARRISFVSGDLAMWNNLWVREVTTTLLHASCTAVFGAFIGYSRSLRKMVRAYFVINGFILAVVIHGFWNFLANYLRGIQTDNPFFKYSIPVYLFILFGSITIGFFILVRRESHLTKQPVFADTLKGHVLQTILFFALIVAGIIFSYRFFIANQVKNSEEYQTASYFVKNSQTLKDELVGNLEGFDFSDIQVTEKDGYGICEINFNLLLPKQLTETIRVGLVKVADFWVVYQVVLDPFAPRSTPIVSTYQKIIWFLERVDLNDVEAVKYFLEEIKKENADPVLLDYLSAKAFGLEALYVDAETKLTNSLSKTHYSKSAILYDQAMVAFAQQKYQDAIQILLNIESLYAEQYQAKEKKENGSIFENLPKDPFLALLNPENVLAATRKTLALSYLYSGNYEQGLVWADKAVAQAELIHSSVVKLNSVYIRALNLYYLQRFEEAETAFTTVATDIDNPNLSQKAMAYFYKADVAARFKRYEDSLDYYEIAVNLDPTNSLIRKTAIEYLVKRNFVGDYELALSLAIRGMDYDVQKEEFKKWAALIYQRLGLADRTVYMQ